MLWLLLGLDQPTLTKLLGEVSRQEMLLRLGYSLQRSALGHGLMDGLSRQEKESWGKGSVRVARGSQGRPGAQAVSCCWRRLRDSILPLILDHPSRAAMRSQQFVIPTCLYGTQVHTSSDPSSPHLALCGCRVDGWLLLPPLPHHSCRNRLR